MDPKKALELVNQMLSEAKKDSLTSTLEELKRYSVELKKKGFEPLKKAIDDLKEDMKKVDPTTKLPGTLLDKNRGYEMGNSNMSMTNSDTTKAEPTANPVMQASEGKKQLAAKIAKCMSSMKKGSAVNLSMSQGLQKDTVRPDAGFGSVTVKDSPAPSMGSVVVKDDRPHPAGSPQDKAHDIVEEGLSIKGATKELGSHPKIQKMFEHLRSKKDNPNWERSKANEEVGKSDNSEDMSTSAKEAIVESADKPFKVQPERPGQANKPSRV